MVRGLHVPVYASFPGHRKTILLAAKVGWSRRETIGFIVEFWTWALTNADADGLIPGVYETELGLLFEGATEDVVREMLRVGLLDKTELGLSIHDWEETGGKVVTTLERDAQRKRRARGQSKDCPPERPPERPPDIPLDNPPDSPRDSPGDSPRDVRGRRDETRRDKTRRRKGSPDKAGDLPKPDSPSQQPKAGPTDARRLFDHYVGEFIRTQRRQPVVNQEKDIKTFKALLTAGDVELGRRIITSYLEDVPQWEKQERKLGPADIVRCANQVIERFDDVTASEPEWKPFDGDDAFTAAEQWEAIVLEMRKKIGGDECKEWIEPLEPVGRMENGALVVATENEIVLGWVRSKLLGRLEKAAEGKQVWVVKG